MNSRGKYALVLIAALAARSFAQGEPSKLHDTDTPVAEPSTPPLVSGEADAQPEPTPGEPLELPGPIANQPRLDLLEPDAPGRGLRLGMSVLLGAGAGAALAVVGGFIAAAQPANPKLQPVGNAWTGASVGFAVGAPLGVLVSGLIFKGSGSWWATILGDVLGLGLGALSVLVGGTAGTPLLFALPLGGSVLGYELSAAPPRPH